MGRLSNQEGLMFGRFFKKSPPKAESQPRPAEANPAAESLKRVIAERKKEDPLIGVKIGSKEVVQRLINGMKDEKGVHIESLLTALVLSPAFPAI
jgi:hypothetical protein